MGRKTRKKRRRKRRRKKKKKKTLSTLTLAVLTHFFLFSRTLQMMKKKRVGLKQCLLLILSVERHCLQET